ncbi:MAG: hypothetical protein GEV11_08470 [Streptosporangiales bacterium]|nr:hypothetical protein [Streptosporangiales bacterium]
MPAVPRVPEIPGGSEPLAAPQRRRLPLPAIIALQLLGVAVALPLALYLPMRDGLAAEAEEKANQERVQNIPKMKYGLLYNTRWIPAKITENKSLFDTSPAPPGAVEVKVDLFLKPMDATAVKRSAAVSYELRDSQGRKWQLSPLGTAKVPGKVEQFALTCTIPRNKFNEVRLVILPKSTPLKGMKSVPPALRFETWNVI